VHLLDYGLLGMKADVPKQLPRWAENCLSELYEETPDTLTTLYEFDKFNLVGSCDGY